MINSPMIISIKFIHIVIQTTEGRKNLGNINVDAHEILRFALNDTYGCNNENQKYRLR